MMASELIISVSGLRGIVGESLTPDIACGYAAAFAQTLPDGPVVVTRDGRANGAELLAPVAAGLSHGGPRQILDAGIAATPTAGVLVRHLGCAGGIQISASHNPAEYNGLKLFSAEGRVVPAAAGQAVLERFRTLEAGRWMPVESSPSNIQYPAPRIQHLSDAVSAHLALLETIVDIDRIRSRRFRVLLDANHGSGSALGKPLLKRLGCNVTMVGGVPDGQFSHLPEPTAENLSGVLSDVTRAGADIGFCQDPDADRLAIIDKRGRYIGEEYTLALCVEHVLRATPGPVVTNCSTSRMTEDLAKKYNVPFFRAAVGEANVVDLMLRERAVIGGEGNGGVIDPRVGMVRDSFVGMALMLDAMAARGKSVGALADDLPRYSIHKAKVEMPRETVADAFKALEQHFSDAKPDRLDGLRLDWHEDGDGSRWLLVRASNTEPIVRIIAEAADAENATRLCVEAAAILRRATA
jgi:phosphomannomutase